MTTLLHQLESWSKTAPNRLAIADKINGTWQNYTWFEYRNAVREVAKGLIQLGHQVGDCVALVGANRCDWVISQLGIMAARGSPAPIYPTSTVEQTAYIVSHSRSQIAFCDGKPLLEKYLEGNINTQTIVTMDEVEHANERVLSLSKLREIGRNASDHELDKRLAELTEDETALLIYTSGTTGVPKAVMLDHGAMTGLSSALLERYPSLSDAREYCTISYLPLCHIAEQLFTNLLHLQSGGRVYFCPDLKELKEYLHEVRPTLFLGVPRVWEKFQSALESKLAEATGIKANLAKWALKTELDAAKKDAEHGTTSTSLSRTLANKLVISKIKAKLGMDQIRLAATGAAPISVDTLEFFASLGLTIYEGYGMSETVGVVTCPYVGKPRFGFVGSPVRGIELKIAEDGEILVKGRTLTRGYLHMPDETKELFTEDGWLRTGDLGSLNHEGILKIAGRKKDLLITSGGKNIAPAEIEAYLKQVPGVGQAVVIGDRRPYLTALLTLDPESLDDLRSRTGLKTHTSLTELANSREVRAFFETSIHRDCNAKLAPYQTVKKFEILPVEFSVDGGELTPTLKIRRNVVSEKYAAEIAEMYKEPGEQPRAKTVAQNQI